jgi:hypothetical protein
MAGLYDICISVEEVRIMLFSIQTTKPQQFMNITNKVATPAWHLAVNLLL